LRPVAVHHPARSHPGRRVVITCWPVSPRWKPLGPVPGRAAAVLASQGQLIITAVLILAAIGNGQQLHMSHNTIHSHLLSTSRKLGVSSRAHALQRTRELRLLWPRCLGYPPAHPDGARPSGAVADAAERLNPGSPGISRVPARASPRWKRPAGDDRSPGPDRPDPIGLLEEQAKARVPELVPIRRGRMMVSPFTFYRGAALPMASDLSRTPVSGLAVQACGRGTRPGAGRRAAVRGGTHRGPPPRPGLVDPGIRGPMRRPVNGFGHA
jgi:hypothetical protein